MLALFLITYVWAGATVMVALRLFHEIEAGLGQVPPRAPGVSVVWVALWPIVLPIWVLRELRDRFWK